MRLLVVIALAGCSTLVQAQRQKFQLNTETPEGQMLSQAAMETDDAKKLALYEQFLAQHPKHAGSAWAWAQIQPMYMKAEQWDKVIAAADAAIALDPSNAVIAYNALQACEKKKDAACVLDWSKRTEDAAQKTLAVPKPEDEEEAEGWTREVDFAKQVMTRCAYSLYATALQAADPKVIVELGSALDERHPDSEYVPQLAGRYYLALQQSGDKEKALALALRTVEKDKTNEDLLYVAAENLLQGKQEPEKVIEYSQALVSLMETKPAPQGVDPAAWEKKKTTLVGLGHWMTGMAYAGQSNWAETDKAFRASLEGITGNNDLLGPAYFFLGLANYNMSKAQKNSKLRAEASRFNELCSKIRGPYQQQSIRNLNAITLGR